MHIVDLRADNDAAILQVAALLVEDFSTDFPGAWPDLEAALVEVRESLCLGASCPYQEFEASSL